MKTNGRRIERWGFFELQLEAKSPRNPFVDVDFRCRFSHGTDSFESCGFFDGESRFIVRFMPEKEGTWSFRTWANVRELSGIEGSFECVPPENPDRNHGPVRVHDSTNFAYSDGTPYWPVGTTCYVWNHQGAALESQTLATLKKAPFNKIRMCVFPKRYRYNYNEPESYPFEGGLTGKWDISMRDRFGVKPLAQWNFDRLNPSYFRKLEGRILDLQKLGIEADLILFHPYDFGAWGFDRMPRGVNERVLRYLVARLAAFRNVWWSFANEFDLMQAFTLEDWHVYFKLVRDIDPHDHLRSIHNCHSYYDHSLPWVTHASIQSSELDKMDDWVARLWKPVIYDECCYEGDIEMRWGDLTAEEMVNRFWLGFARGGYVGHGETYVNPEEVLWWSKGGALHGKSPKRIAFLRKLLEEARLPDGKQLPGLKPVGKDDRTFMQGGHDGMCRAGDDYYLVYFEDRQPSKRVFEMGSGTYKVDAIDTWNMSIESIGSFTGRCEVPLPRKPRITLRIVRGK